MFNKLKNKKLVSIVSIALAGLLLIGILSAVVLIKPKSVNKIFSSDFVIGKIDSHGKFADSDDYICTKNYIACDGLVINPNFTTDTKFQVFFYDVNGNFVKNTEELSSKYKFVGSVPYVEYCKIMLIPDTNGKPTSEFKVKKRQKSLYVNDFEITVDKVQEESPFKNYFVEENVEFGKMFKYNWSSSSIEGYVDNEDKKATKLFTITDNVNKIYFLHEYSKQENMTCYVYFLSGDKMVHYVSFENSGTVNDYFGYELYEYLFDINEIEKTKKAELTHFVITVDKNIDCYLYSNVELN